MMFKSRMAHILATVSWIPLGVAISPLAAHGQGSGPAITFGQPSGQVVAVDFVEVGITDVVERTALGTLEEQTRNLRITDTVFFNETIATGPDSATRVSFLDDSSLSLGPSSEVVIDRFIYDPAQNTGEMALSLTAGVFRFASGTLESESYTIDTPVGTIGIRGTVIDVFVECAQRASGDCELTMDVVSGFTTFDGADDESVTRQGSRMNFRPAVSPRVEISVRPRGAAPLPGLEEMGERINQNVVDLYNGALPPGVTFDTATPAQLAEAAVRLGSQNPRLGDLLVEAVSLSRPDALGPVASGLMSNVPESTRRVVGALASALGPPTTQRELDDPFIDDDPDFDNSLPNEEPSDEEPPDEEPPDEEPPDEEPPEDPRDRFDDIRDDLEDVRDDTEDVGDRLRG